MVGGRICVSPTGGSRIEWRQGGAATAARPCSRGGGPHSARRRWPSWWRWGGGFASALSRWVPALRLPPDLRPNDLDLVVARRRGLFCKVYEFRPPVDWNKGHAVLYLLRELSLEDSFPIYIGDDVMDEDAFKVLRKRNTGVGILVSEQSRKTSAFFSLKDPSQVMQFLNMLVSWKETGNGRQLLEQRGGRGTEQSTRSHSFSSGTV